MLGYFPFSPKLDGAWLGIVTEPIGMYSFQWGNAMQGKNFLYAPLGKQTQLDWNQKNTVAMRLQELRYTSLEAPWQLKNYLSQLK